MEKPTIHAPGLVTINTAKRRAIHSELPNSLGLDQRVRDYINWLECLAEYVKVHI